MTDPDEHTGPTIRDRRRIDPDTYQVREPQQPAAPATAASAPAAPAGTPPTGADPTADAEPSEVDRLTTQLAERTADLQRLQAEYVNYKRRVDRDRDVARTRAVENLFAELLPVFDNIDSARTHGELTGGFKAVAEDLAKIAGRHGLETYGAAGDPFDPNIHEALMHAHADDITGPTCVQILQPGYKVGDRVIRPARVAVAEPTQVTTETVDNEPSDASGDSAATTDPDPAGGAGRS